MSSNAIVTTVVGWAATEPREIHAGRVPYTSFRLASTPRHFDCARGVWVEGRTEWLTVKVFRDTALNVAGSVHKGQPLVVTGRLRTEEWQGENGARSGLVLEASALGHDLTRGRATFVKTKHVAAGSGDADDAGAAPGAGEVRGGPADGADVDPWLVDASAFDDAPVLSDAVAAELAALAEDDVEDEIDAAMDEAIDEVAEQLAAGVAVEV
ncbi:single-stranded DNA-binding protein [Actinotalea fermentans]|uniref:Single-stranded DNA-binding protein n=1 Tax=Actinotalea fermentans TaxID=43671 RepID=A0A511YW62_9CELL|nr:single-stranded DNA-binding protein [Actinotalea fermentans]GEN79441.1 single-stranded DNA-binding protein [Actinotalea fermentans]